MLMFFSRFKNKNVNWNLNWRTKMAASTSTFRLRQDYLRLMRDPVPFITAAPLPTNILEWHYVVEGPSDSVYAGGFYHGKLIFPKEYPFKPPSIMMLTPNGRFKTNTRLCLSISDFHPDTWNPAWCVSTILTGLLSFMLETSPTLGSIETSVQTKRQLALQSIEHNIKDSIFQEVFPELFKKLQDLTKQREAEMSRAITSQNMTSPNSTNSRSSDVNRRNGTDYMNDGSWTGTLMNLGVIFGFAAFSFVVKYIWKLVVNEQL
ncbi:ubiquitin-conjugating enzyme E2 J2-like [Convolutriloba macropyga]|uniref:ubiquitin-conjugating enzyme E2 J2-like n=1 Tax=Convolutriloba macropyga TaxID=536237 RepID=UPI003F521148